jgi:hypothetical protein
VRRSNDNAESDFSEADINGGALAAWVGAGNSGFIPTWYDQTGNGRNLFQGTAGQQPRLVSSGAVTLENSRPVLEFFNSRTDFLTTGNQGLGLPMDFYIVGRYRSFSGCAGSAIRGFLHRTGTSSGGLMVRENCGTIQFANTTALQTGASDVTTTRRIFNFYFDSGASSLFIVDNTTLISGNIGTSSPTGGFALATDAQIATRGGEVNFQEVIVYPSSQSRRVDIRSAINNHYKVF